MKEHIFRIEATVEMDLTNVNLSAEDWVYSAAVFGDLFIAHLSFQKKCSKAPGPTKLLTEVTMHEKYLTTYAKDTLRLDGMKFPDLLDRIKNEMQQGTTQPHQQQQQQSQITDYADANAFMNPFAVTTITSA